MCFARFSSFASGSWSGLSRIGEVVDVSRAHRHPADVVQRLVELVAVEESRDAGVELLAIGVVARLERDLAVDHLVVDAARLFAVDAGDLVHVPAEPDIVSVEQMPVVPFDVLPQIEGEHGPALE